PRPPAVRPPFLQQSGLAAAEGLNMNTPEWLKPGLYGAVAGGILVAVAGFTWAGWTTAGGADRMAQAMAGQRVVAAMVPVCLGLSAADPDRAAKLATIQEATVPRRREALMATGWATMPGT